MNVKGIRISDIRDSKCIPLVDLLVSMGNEKQFHWGLLWLDVNPIPTQGKLLSELQEEVNNSENGISCTFESLVSLSKGIFQEIEVLIIGCTNNTDVHRYKEDQEMYKTCDVTIEMIDGGFWEVFAKDSDLIDRLSKKFKNTEIINPDDVS